MLDRTAEQFEVAPSRLVADAGYGSAEMIGWLVGRAWNRAARETDGQVRAHGRRPFARADFAFDPEGNLFVCPGGKELRKYHRSFSKPRDGVTKEGTMIYFARKRTARPARSSPSAARTRLRAESRALFMKPLATRPAQSPRPRPTPSHVANERRSRCSLLI